MNKQTIAVLTRTAIYLLIFFILIYIRQKQGRLSPTKKD